MVTDTPDDALVERVKLALWSVLSASDEQVPSWFVAHIAADDLPELARAAIAAMPEIAALRAENDAMRAGLRKADSALTEVLMWPVGFTDDAPIREQHARRAGHYTRLRKIAAVASTAVRALLGSKP